MAKTTFIDGNQEQGIQGTKVTAVFLNSLNLHRHTGQDVDGAGVLDYAVATGTNNAYAITLTPALSALVNGMPITFRANHTNTGAVTLNVDGLGARSLIKGASANLEAGDIEAGQLITVAYNGTAFQVVSRMARDAGIPPGTVAHYAGQTPPTGWLERNGAAISRTAYAALFAVIGTTYGVGDGSTTFNLPDDRGRFDRGWAHDQTTYDSGRQFGSAQDDAMQPITGSVTCHRAQRVSTATGAFTKRNDSGEYFYGETASDFGFNFNSALVTRTANETRPLNRAFLPIIKY